MRTGALVAVLVAGLMIPALAGAGPGQNGLYKGEATNVDSGADEVEIEFRVAKGGTRIKKWTAQFLAVCPGLIPIAQLINQPMPTIKVNRKGRFRKVLKGEPEGLKTRIEVSGNLKGSTVKKGKLSYKVGLCRRGSVDKPVRWKAKRVRP